MRGFVWKDRLIGIVSLLLGLIYFGFIMNLPPTNLAGDPGPRVFPAIGAILFVVCGISLILKKRPEREKKVFLAGNEWKRLWALFAIIIFYAVSLYLLGFVISTPLILFVISSLFAAGKGVPLWHRLVYSVLATVIIYYLFTKGFAMTLPQGIIF